MSVTDGIRTALIPLRNQAGRIVGCALIDVRDLHLAEHRWHRTSEGYARRSGPGGQIYMHREIVAIAPGTTRDGVELFVDHANRDRLDNRRENLRIVTRAEQQQNLSPQRKGTSRYRGVYRRKEGGRWVAQIRIDGKTVCLGTFDTEDEAGHVAARARAEHMPFSTV